MVKIISGRMAKCYCGTLRPSTEALGGTLAFFEYRGPGSRESTESCICGYDRCAHDVEYMRANTVGKRTVIESGKCTGFVSRGPNPTDTFYCGCRGWD